MHPFLLCREKRLESKPIAVLDFWQPTSHSEPMAAILFDTLRFPPTLREKGRFHGILSLSATASGGRPPEPRQKSH